jgi:hypothetical protein
MTVRIISSALTSAINSAFTGEAKAVALARAKQDKAIQQALDAMTLACVGSKADFMKGNSASNSARGEVKAIFDGLVEAKHLAKASAAMYQSSFWMAFENGVPFKRDLATKPKGATVEKTAGASKTVSVTRENLIKSIAATVAMAKALGLTMLAQDIQDIAAETLDAKF